MLRTGGYPFESVVDNDDWDNRFNAVSGDISDFALLTKGDSTAEDFYNNSDPRNGCSLYIGNADIPEGWPNDYQNEDIILCELQIHFHNPYDVPIYVFVQDRFNQDHQEPDGYFAKLRLPKTPEPVWIRIPVLQKWNSLPSSDDLKSMTDRMYVFFYLDPTVDNVPWYGVQLHEVQIMFSVLPFEADVATCLLGEALMGDSATFFIDPNDKPVLQSLENLPTQDRSSGLARSILGRPSAATVGSGDVLIHDDFRREVGGSLSPVGTTVTTNEGTIITTGIPGSGGAGTFIKPGGSSVGILDDRTGVLTFSNREFVV